MNSTLQRSCVSSSKQAKLLCPARVTSQCFKPVRMSARLAVAGASHMHATAKSDTARASMACKASARPAVFLFGFGADDDDYEEAYTVLKLQLGIFGDITKWQRMLERTAELHDTDEEGGLHAILQEVLTQLLRNTEYISYATSGGRVFNDLNAAESKFNEVTFEERAKFKEETFSNVEGRLSRARRSGQDASLKDLDQWMCVTLVLAVERELKLPKISSVFDLKQVIKTLAGVTVDELLAFELMWTPEDEGDSYSRDELLADYPSMATLS